ncbi:MAG TPA: tyrosine-protein phosphatase [Kofleriaceae bacterium]|nr:tyrosine-protein phosphatase [Kofleriaceae bacterium]
MAARAAVPPLTWVALGAGALALSHRPRKVALAAWRDQGATHVVTLLGAHEGAPEIGAEAQRAGLTWIWIAMAGAAIPDEAATRELRPRLAEVADVVRGGGRAVIHCSAGIHRTGMIGYAVLRLLGAPPDLARSQLAELRDVTAEGVGADRQAWGDALADG